MRAPVLAWCLLTAAHASAATPSYLTALPLECQAASAASAFAESELALSLCRPKAAATSDLATWVQMVGDALGNAGYPPSLSFGPLGPHLTAFVPGGMISATFVRHDEASFDVWLSEQRFAGRAVDLPTLPAGASVVADQRDERGRLLAIELPAPWRKAKALVSATLSALGATASEEHALKHEGMGGRLSWEGKSGFYQTTPVDGRRTQLTLFVSEAE